MISVVATYRRWSDRTQSNSNIVLRASDDDSDGNSVDKKVNGKGE